MRDKIVSGMGSLSPNCGDKVEEGKEQMNCMNNTYCSLIAHSCMHLQLS